MANNINTININNNINNIDNIDNTNKLGRCECIDLFNRNFLISSLKKQIDDEKNYIKKIEYDKKLYETREKYSPQYSSPDALIRIRKKIIDTTELVLKRIENTPEC